MDIQTHNPTAILLLKTAERLFALHGIDSVSTRQIAREAGQKNHSALQYHFGSRDDLVDAILAYRMAKANRRRAELWASVEAQGQLGDIRSLVMLIVQPLAEELLQAPQESYYIGLIAQLYSRDQAGRVYLRDSDFFDTARAVSDRLAQQLSEMPEALLFERLIFLGSQLVHAVADWDFQRRDGRLQLDAKMLQRKVNNLVDFLVGGLTAPASTGALL